MTVERITVVGAGTMGRGIALVAAQSGHRVVLRDVDTAILQRAHVAIRETLDAGIAKGKVRPEERDAALARITLESDMDRAVRDCDLVIEAVPEDITLKRRVLAEAAAQVGPQTILATNTSSLSITEIARGLPDPGRVVGMHFFNPPHLLKLVEIVRGAETSDASAAAAIETARRMGKEPIVVRDSPGLASSRLGLVLGLEAIRMLEQGVATAEDIDKAMELGYNHPMGPLKLTDLVGLDVRLAIAEHLHRTLGSEAFRPPELLRRLVSEGRLGRKTGRGFYEYPAASPAKGSNDPSPYARMP